MKFVTVILVLMLAMSAQERVAAQYAINEEIRINVFIDSTFSDYQTLEIIASTNNNQQITPTLPTDFSDTISRVQKISVQRIGEQEHKSIIEFLRSIEVNGNTGNKFNLTAFEVGLKNESIIPKEGKSYNASATLKWIGDNLWNQVNNEYSLYIFNFTELDTDGKEHWFTSFPEDIDTGKFVSRFYSGAKKLTYGMDNMGWGGEYNLPIQFIDLSARSWYGNFVNSVWGKYNWNADSISKNLSDWTGNYSTVAYYDWLTGIVTPMFWRTFSNWNWATSSLIRGEMVITEVEVRNYVFSNWTEEQSWILHDKRIEEKFERNFPWLDFIVETKWMNLSEDKELEMKLNEEMVFDTEEQVYKIPLEYGFINYIENILLPKYVPINYSRVQLPSFSFLVDDNVHMTYGGVSIAGLGGQGWQIQSVTPSRVFDEDGQPLVGLSSVMVHEIGHSIGLPHPFINDGYWSSDFTASVMGYFNKFNDFSRFDRDSVGRDISLYYLWKLEKGNEEYNDLALQSIVDAARIEYEHWNFSASIALLFNGLERLNDLNDGIILPTLTSSTTTLSSTTSSSTTILNSSSSISSTTSLQNTELSMIAVITAAPAMIIRRKIQRS